MLSSPKEEVQNIASMGGQQRAANIEAEKESGHPNPGNFANR